MSLIVTVLALFYESVKSGAATKEIKNNNKLDKGNITTHPSKIYTICGQNVCNFIFMLGFSIFIKDQ